jgi:hypothetical protein
MLLLTTLQEFDPDIFDRLLEEFDPDVEPLMDDAMYQQFLQVSVQPASNLCFFQHDDKDLHGSLVVEYTACAHVSNCQLHAVMVTRTSSNSYMDMAIAVVAVVDMCLA